MAQPEDLFVSVEYNQDSKELTFTRKDGTTDTVDTSKTMDFNEHDNTLLAHVKNKPYTSAVDDVAQRDNLANPVERCMAIFPNYRIDIYSSLENGWVTLFAGLEAYPIVPPEHEEGVEYQKGRVVRIGQVWYKALEDTSLTPSDASPAWKVVDPVEMYIKPCLMNTDLYIINQYAIDNTNQVPDYGNYNNIGVVMDNFYNIPFINKAIDASDGPGTNTTDEAVAIAQAVVDAFELIHDYAVSSANTVPTLQTYTTAQLEGVTAENLAAINSAIDAATGAEADSLPKIQEIINQVNAGDGGGAGNDEAIYDTESMNLVTTFNTTILAVGSKIGSQGHLKLVRNNGSNHLNIYGDGINIECNSTVPSGGQTEWAPTQSSRGLASLNNGEYITVDQARVLAANAAFSNKRALDLDDPDTEYSAIGVSDESEFAILYDTTYLQFYHIAAPGTNSTQVLYDELDFNEIVGEQVDSAYIHKGDNRIYALTLSGALAEINLDTFELISQSDLGLDISTLGGVSMTVTPEGEMIVLTVGNRKIYKIERF